MPENNEPKCSGGCEDGKTDCPACQGTGSGFVRHDCNCGSCGGRGWEWCEVCGGTGDELNPDYRFVKD